MNTVEQPERFGERLRGLRRAKGWNQMELAARVGVKPTQISKLELGAYEPRLSTLCRMAAALGTSTDYLLMGKEAAPGEPDRLAILWPVLERLPPGLRNEIADFLETVLYAQHLLGIGGLARARRERRRKERE